MAGADAILAQLRSQRLQWVELGAVRIQVDTPSVFRAQRIAAALRVGDGDAAIREIAPLVVEWEGVTGAFLLGAAVGSADPVPVHPGLFERIAGDRPEWVSALAMAVLDATGKARTAIEAASGN